MSRTSGPTDIISYFLRKWYFLAPFRGFFMGKILDYGDKKNIENRKITIGKLNSIRIFAMVFHRILDFKNGAGFLSGPFFFTRRSAKGKDSGLPENLNKLYPAK